MRNLFLLIPFSFSLVLCFSSSFLADMREEIAITKPLTLLGMIERRSVGQTGSYTNILHTVFHSPVHILNFKGKAFLFGVCLQERADVNVEQAGVRLKRVIISAQASVHLKAGSRVSLDRCNVPIPTSLCHLPT